MCASIHCFAPRALSSLLNEHISQRVQTLRFQHPLHPYPVAHKVLAAQVMYITVLLL